jgi:hypothetical protein
MPVVPDKTVVKTKQTAKHFFVAWEGPLIHREPGVVATFNAIYQLSFYGIAKMNGRRMLSPSCYQFGIALQNSQKT